MIPLLIVDDHQIVRLCLRQGLAQASGVKIVGEAQNGEEALRLMREHRPRVVLLDINLPDGISGLEVIRRGLQHNPDLCIVVLTASCNLLTAQHALEAGARGYLHKDADVEELVCAIRAVNRGEIHIAKAMATRLALRQTVKSDSSPFDALSRRELEVLLLIARGLKVKAIAEALHVSEKTVNGYRYCIQKALDVSNDVSMVTMAIRHGIFDVEESFDLA